MKVHLHEEQFDGALHPWCGRGETAVNSVAFEAALPNLRCRLCDHEWFPHGQPEWHYKAAKERLSNYIIANVGRVQVVLT
jgi:hypothetical protein